ncbi:hypothetical protein L9F63_024866, partial [Diploptera punctata]
CSIFKLDRLQKLNMHFLIHFTSNKLLTRTLRIKTDEVYKTFRRVNLGGVCRHHTVRHHSIFVFKVYKPTKVL